MDIIIFIPFQCSQKHYDDTPSEGLDRPGTGLMKCPVCSLVVQPATDFVDAEEVSELRASLRMLKVPVLFRLDRDDGDENGREERLFGDPHLIKVASRLPGAVLYKIVGKLVPYHSNYSIVLVDGQVCIPMLICSKM